MTFIVALPAINTSAASEEEIASYDRSRKNVDAARVLVSTALALQEGLLSIQEAYSLLLRVGADRPNLVPGDIDPLTGVPVQSAEEFAQELANSFAAAYADEFDALKPAGRT